MSRLPIPGGDTSAWGSILNDYLQVAHNADGTSKFLGSRVSRGTNQTGVVTSTLTKVTFDAVRYGDTSWWSAGSPTKITLPLTGYYTVGGVVEFSANVNGERYADIFKNNTTIVSELAGGVACTTGGFPVCQGSSPALFAAGDFIEMRVYQNSGTDRILLTEPWGPDMWAFFEGV